MQGRLGRVECRCTRAWLPPSALWLFRPRAETHDTGGWYFERYTECSPYGRRGSHRLEPLLPAAVHVLIAAYETLDEEELTRSSGRGNWISSWLSEQLYALWRGRSGS
uniref:Heat shock protein binding n=1 Tax=Tetraselmis sp. GSL018 TaxID=582737 RepID=A0A061R9Y8_9CHLO